MNSLSALNEQTAKSSVTPVRPQRKASPSSDHHHPPGPDPRVEVFDHRLVRPFGHPRAERMPPISVATDSTAGTRPSKRVIRVSVVHVRSPPPGARASTASWARVRKSSLLSPSAQPHRRAEGAGADIWDRDDLAPRQGAVEVFDPDRHEPHIGAASSSGVVDTGLEGQKRLAGIIAAAFGKDDQAGATIQRLGHLVDRIAYRAPRGGGRSARR